MRCALTKRPNRAEHRPDGTTVIFLERRNGEVYECLVDTIDYPLVKDYRWHVLKVDYLLYGASTVRKPNGKQGALLLHCVLLPDSEDVDHKNRNGLDNRKENLRRAAGPQNLGNTKKPRHGTTSKFKGVSLARGDNKFRAGISVQHKTVHLGRFISEEDAARAYNQAAQHYFGEFANLNQVEPLITA